MSRQGIHHSTLPPPPPPSVSSNSSQSSVHHNNNSVQQLLSQQQAIFGSPIVPLSHQQLSSTSLIAHGGGGMSAQIQQQQQQQQQQQSQQQQFLQQNPQILSQQLTQEQISTYHKNALQRIRDDLKPFNKGPGQDIQQQQLPQQNSSQAQRRPSSASSNASSSCSFSTGMLPGGSYPYNGLVSPASSVSSYGQIGGGSNKGTVPPSLPIAQNPSIQPQHPSSSSSQNISANNLNLSCDNPNAALSAMNDSSSQFYRQMIEKSLPEDMLAMLQEKGLVNLLENILKNFPSQQQQSSQAAPPQQPSQISHPHQIVIDRANHHLGAASHSPANINLNSVIPPPPPSLSKILRSKQPSPSTSQLESLESSSIYSAASERSVASCLSSSCSVRSESPASNLHSQQSHHVNGGHLLPDQPRIVSSNGVVIPNTNHNTSLNNGVYHSHSSHHLKLVQTDSSGISCSEYSSGSAVDGQSDYTATNSSYPLPLMPYHRLPQQQAQQQFTESSQPAAIAAKRLIISKLHQNTIHNNHVGTQQQPQSQQQQQQQPPSQQQHQQLQESTKNQSTTTNFRPRDPLPPPPLPHRSTTTTISSSGFHGQLPPPPVPPHNSKNYSFQNQPSIVNSQSTTVTLAQQATNSFAFPSQTATTNGSVGHNMLNSIPSSASSVFMSQITQKLQNLSIQSQPFSQTNPSSPPPSYAASSSSGRQSPTPTISSSSDYASIPMVQPSSSRKRTEILESKFKASGIAHALAGPAIASNIVGISETDSEPTEQNGAFQGWPAKHAQTQSPVIMQSVKSQKVQKPILQTAIAPSMCSITSPLTNGQSSSQQQTQQPRRQHVPTGFAIQPTVPIHSSTSLLSPLSNNVINGNGNVLTPPPSYKPQKSNPPPYPIYSKQENQNYHSNPPPSYSSTVNASTTGQTSSRHRSHTSLQPTGGMSQIPPTPKPPLYSVSLNQQSTSLQQDSLQPLYRSTASTASIYSVGSNSSSSTAPANVQVPTTDPPSYASSMAALAAQRAQASTGPSTTTSGACKTISSTSNPPASMINRQLPPTPTSEMISQREGEDSNNSSNCDLVNTVDAICTSQISALQGMPTSHCSSHLQENDALVPPLPPKPSSVRNDVAPPPPPPPLPPSLHYQLASDVSSISSSMEDYDQSKNVNEDNDNALNNGEDVEDPETGKRTHTSPIPTRKNISRAKEKERREVKIKNYSPAAFKFYMEQHMENVIKNQKERELRRQKLESEMAMERIQPEGRDVFRKMLYMKESNHIRLKRAKMDITMFKKICNIGVGAFGLVTLVTTTFHKKGNPVLYAMKTLRKSNVLQRKQVAHVKAERDILAEADNEWVVKLYYSFQDEKNLYFVMEYIPGGDLMALLYKLSIFDEDLARFYISELVVAVESVHKMGFIHRDIKPDNVLIDKNGHIKLTDFGLCTGFRWTHNSKYYHDRANSIDFDAAASGWNTVTCNCGQQAPQPALNNAKPLERRNKRCEHHRCLAISLVGTPNYIAPEVLMGYGYTQGCDWWSVGVILYEMVVGSPPFYAETPLETQAKVISWRDTLSIPHEANLKPPCKDLILKLICDAESRLGRNGADEIKRHSFFESVNFEAGLRNQKAPYVPEIRHATDISNFEQVDLTRINAEDDPFAEYDLQHSLAAMKAAQEAPKHPQHAFFEFTFRRFFDGSGQEMSYGLDALTSSFPIESDTQEDDNSETPIRNDNTNTSFYPCGTDSTMSERTSSQVSGGDLYDEVYNEQHPNASASTSSANSSATATNKSQQSRNNNNSNNATDSDSNKADQDPSNNPVFV